MENADQKNLFSDKQIRSYFENLERHLKASDINERRRIFLSSNMLNKFISALTRTVKRDIVKLRKVTHLKNQT